jgi:spore germination cell wall hydrolase CwlJ-like protein
MITFTVVSVNYGNEFRLFQVKYTDLTKDAKKQVDCLAENIYHEAGSESENGKIAVAMVTLNRVQDNRFGKDICSVVKQKVNSTCQFSWFCSAPKLNRNSSMFTESMQVALHVYANYENLKDITKGALYYHADYVNPQWKLQKTTVIGRHIFYKEGGKNDAKTKSTTQGRPI